MATTKSTSTTIANHGITNYSILSLPAAYLLALSPYYYQFARSMTASGFTATNITPRTNLEILKSKIPEATWKGLVRARGAHLNGLEGFPLFAGAMLAGNWAGVPTGDLNSAAGQYLGVRVLYNVLYMTTTNEAASYLRSGAYAWSLAIPFYVLWKAHKKLNGGLDEDTKVSKLGGKML